MTGFFFAILMAVCFYVMVCLLGVAASELFIDQALGQCSKHTHWFQT